MGSGHHDSWSRPPAETTAQPRQFWTPPTPRCSRSLPPRPRVRRSRPPRPCVRRSRPPPPCWRFHPPRAPRTPRGVARSPEVMVQRRSGSNVPGPGRAGGSGSQTRTMLTEAATAIILDQLERTDLFDVLKHQWSTALAHGTAELHHTGPFAPADRE
jgi:hypothetical protein